MIFNRMDLDHLKTPNFEVREAIEIDSEIIENHPRCTALRDIFAVGHMYYDSHSSTLIADISIEGIMTVPCAITLNPFDIDFSTRVSEVFSFDSVDAEAEDEGIIEVDGEELDMTPYIVGAILAEVPLKAIDPNLDEYPKGDGWIVMTEEDYIKEKSQQIDPRLAKLKDFKLD
ncbi:DUF177 domain-containing protein [Erysipelothrix inopinata]|uniref:DUF177 domain-containing protein n=1 Tax=Erysipelothrix inopinata TaxID=225084 RepID=A0A7G9RYB8_9FIRM|nr:DUF177 domain-containing protein [Erysipelothrix inopinata]QNN60593.1 DUF177 domain-containing protein [Erysipelothrix inopinata]